jgi:hypothetical protein
MLQLLSIDDRAYTYLDLSLQLNPLFIKSAFIKNPSIFKHITFHNNAFLKELIAINGYCLKWAPHDLQDDPELVLEGMRTYARAFLSASIRLKENKDFLIKAIPLFPMGYKELKHELKDDLELAQLALSKSGSLLEYASLKIQSDIDMIKIALTQSVFALAFVNKALKAQPLFQEMLKKEFPKAFELNGVI